jgi:hypothetical protein
VKWQAFALALTANGVIASSRKARGPDSCASRSPEVIERIKSLRRQHMLGKEIAPTVDVLPSGQPHVQASGPEQAARVRREREIRFDLAIGFGRPVTVLWPHHAFVCQKPTTTLDCGAGGSICGIRKPSRNSSVFSCWPSFRAKP